ncbi:Protein phosphatase 1L [Frankliniella fusca]|uniref:Protein phosphatase 1L n=1 Tax=Frankliniella fusca TaxID=407009 RepID=A0AAE1HD33_9NEOP|nr:Protein phosphatase 1L [Frankliniella fusca]
MEDDLEDRVLYQTYVSHMKLMSRLSLALPGSLRWSWGGGGPGGHAWRLLRLYVLRPEVLVCGAVMILVLAYLQAADAWAPWARGPAAGVSHVSPVRSLFSRLQGLRQLVNGSVGVGAVSGAERLSWELREGEIAAYAVQGRRPKMEDRFVVNDNINDTGVALFAVFDGHGGEFAANYAKEKLVPSLNHKVAEIKKFVAEGGVKRHPVYGTPTAAKGSANPGSSTPETVKKGAPVEKKNSFRKTMSTSQTDECVRKNGGVTDPELLLKMDSIPRSITREVRPSLSDEVAPTSGPASTYVDNSGAINYGRLLTDEVLAADYQLVEAAKKTMDVAGTTALIAVMEGSRLIVANVGDSRGVMCDSRGKAIPLSFDHKPQQMRERKRIKEAGGFITFNGVWRVAGILATSRALGDYPLKDKKLVIANPDILTFDLSNHKPQFIILASDGLWDTFSNEEAVAFVRERLTEPHMGAKSLTLQSYYRGSLDNITVVVINLKDRQWNSTTPAQSKAV